VCRFAGYAGPPAPLSTLLGDAPHGLAEQSWDPREQVSGHVNVDGTGIAWWIDGQTRPLRYVSDGPPWTDPNLPHLAPRLRAPLQLAVVRSATPGLPCGAGSTPPLLDGDLALAHNGRVEAFGDLVLPRLLARLTPAEISRLDVVTDTRLVLLVLARCRAERPGEGLARALVRALVEVAEDAARSASAATLNVLVGDGREILATRFARGREADSLAVIEDGPRWPGAALVASEPLDHDPGWRRLPEDMLVRLTPDGRAAVLPFEEVT
jgi:glutamine amidotransferase